MRSDEETVKATQNAFQVRNFLKIQAQILKGDLEGALWKVRTESKTHLPTNKPYRMIGDEAPYHSIDYRMERRRM